MYLRTWCKCPRLAKPVESFYSRRWLPQKAARRRSDHALDRVALRASHLCQIRGGHGEILDSVRKDWATALFEQVGLDL